jgi:hypothetical protein
MTAHYAVSSWSAAVSESEQKISSVVEIQFTQCRAL